VKRGNGNMFSSVSSITVKEYEIAYFSIPKV
jgi:hypothetical protein